MRPKYNNLDSFSSLLPTLVQLRDCITRRHLLGATARTPAVPQKQLIACVDDDVSAREALAGLLKAFGFVTRVFSSAEEFLQSDRLGEASCLITDVHLGGMSGLQLQRLLAASGHRIPVIVITAFPDDRVRERALSAGAICFLSKPFKTADLLTGIRSALDRQHALLGER
jgi:FixJ family two-component response regulator